MRDWRELSEIAIARGKVVRFRELVSVLLSEMEKVQRNEFRTRGERDGRSCDGSEFRVGRVQNVCGLKGQCPASPGFLGDPTPICPFTSVDAGCQPKASQHTLISFVFFDN